MSRFVKAFLPILTLAPLAALIPSGCGTTSASKPTETPTPQPGTAIVSGQIVKAGTPLASANLQLWQSGGGQFGSQTSDGSGNFTFSAVPVNSSNNQWYVKWLGAVPYDPGGGTVDFTEFGLVQTKPFAITTTQTYTLPTFDTGTQSMTLSAPTEYSTQTVSGSQTINFVWNAYTASNTGYGFRLDNDNSFGNVYYQYPSSGWTPSLLTAAVTSSNVPATPTNQMYWRAAVEEANQNGIEVVASTKYWRVRFN